MKFLLKNINIKFSISKYVRSRYPRDNIDIVILSCNIVDKLKLINLNS